MKVRAVPEGGQMSFRLQRDSIPTSIDEKVVASTVKSSPPHGEDSTFGVR